MTHRGMLGRSVVFAPLFATLCLPAQDNSTWEENFVRGSEAIRAGRYPEARRILLAALVQARSFGADDVRRAQSNAVLATVYQLQGELKLADPLYLEARAILEANGDAGRSSLAYVLDSLGQLRLEQGRWVEAEQLLKQSRLLYEQTDGPNSLTSMSAVRHLGELYACLGRHAEAEALLKQTVVFLRKSEKPGVLAATLVSLGHLYMIEGHPALAESALKEAMDLDLKLRDGNPSLADAMVNLAALYRVEGQTARAEPLLRKAAKIYTDAGDPHLAGVLSETGLIALGSKKYATAEKNLLEALAMVTRANGPENIGAGLVEASLAEVYLAERDYGKAESFIRRALAKERTFLGDSSFEVAKSLLIVAQIEEKQNRQSEAQSDYREAVTLYGKSIGADHPEAVHAQELYTRFVKKMRK